MDPINEEIKRRADIVEVISQYVALRPAGHGRFKACCPFHDEKTPSFNVSQERGFYKCFGCNKSGDVFKFLQEIENISFPEAKRQLAERYGVQLPAFGRELTPEQQLVYDERDKLLKITAAAAAFFREQFAGNKGLPARDYARSRGLSPNTLEKFGIGYAPDAWDGLFKHLNNKYGFRPHDAAEAGLLVEKEGEEGKPSRFYDRYRHRLIFPIWDPQGRVIAFGGRALEGGETGTPDAKYINSPEGPLFNKSRTLYGWHLARPEIGKRESVIITEGYMDAIALHEAGFSNTIATLGTSLTTQHVAALARISPRNVYLCYDGDSAGIRAALRSAPLFASHDLRVRVVMLPGGEDPDTFIKKFGPIPFETALRDAQLLSRYRLEMAIADFDLRDVAQRMEGIRAGAEVIAEIDNEIEKDDYIAWLADRWGAAENVTSPTRLQVMQGAVRREVGDAIKRQHQQARPYSPAPPRAEAVETEESPAVKKPADESLSGAAKAERMLLASLLSNPAWRTRIFGALPPSRWTEEAHREIATALQKVDFHDTIDPPTLMASLSPEAAAIISELMMSEPGDIAANEAIIADCARRVEDHWAHQYEREILELIQGKLDRGETVDETERSTYREALIATRRRPAEKVEEDSSSSR